LPKPRHVASPPARLSEKKLFQAAAATGHSRNMM
jgi:hypothetical protein